MDFLTRLNRQVGVGTAMISRTMADLGALPEEDRLKAKGFVERAGMVMCGGLPYTEMPELTAVIPFSEAEQELLTGWQDPPAWDAASGREVDPPWVRQVPREGRHPTGHPGTGAAHGG